MLTLCDDEATATDRARTERTGTDQCRQKVLSGGTNLPLDIRSFSACTAMSIRGKMLLRDDQPDGPAVQDVEGYEVWRIFLPKRKPGKWNPLHVS